ncbi:hypothetical protein AAE478_008052 [Parahypoxylon ruwenzoriense]
MGRGSIRIDSSESTSRVELNNEIVDKIVDFDKIHASRPDFNFHNGLIEVTKHPDPKWKYGQGVRIGRNLETKHVEVEPHAPSRPMVNNYRLLISGIAPRPIGFKHGLRACYFQAIDHDPPMCIVGSSSRPGRVKDTYRNLKESGECVINTVSKDMIEAVNASSIDAPYGVSEWDISGFHEAPTSTVRPSRVRESVFSVEGKIVDIKEFNDHQKGGMSVAGLVLVKATRFWVREDATNEDVSHIDLEKLRPLSQLGSILYERVTSTFELPRKRWADECPQSVLLSELEQQKNWGGDIS